MSTGRKIKKLPKSKLGLADENVLKPRGVAGRKGNSERRRKVTKREGTMEREEGASAGGISIYEDIEVDG